MAILQAVREKNGEEYHPISSEFKNLPDTVYDANVALDKMVLAAKRRAQEKADSAKAAEYDKLYKQRQNEERVAAQKQKELERQQKLAAREEQKRIATLSKASQDSAKVAAKAAADSVQAQQCLNDIYEMIGEGKGKAAYDRFMKFRPSLQKYITHDVFETLQSSVIDAKSGLGSR
jgi:hypothetical protein